MGEFLSKPSLLLASLGHGHPNSDEGTEGYEGYEGKADKQDWQGKARQSDGAEGLQREDYRRTESEGPDEEQVRQDRQPQEGRSRQEIAVAPCNPAGPEGIEHERVRRRRGEVT